ncbi:uncharacterized protein LOC131679951 [Topomyia yanbarensis]|uniref:uncharacterized protein LOC131679951 n=1 Tax=Topomyia yanbarensis TaxID=2498891 RepID=UPI00273BE5C0|nr:uncharacterized protein LOC131679951 [Topomyia yanbarensis]
MEVITDDRFSVNNQIDYACEKLAKTTNAIRRIIPNVGGPRSVTRRLLTMLRYVVPAWRAALKTERNCEKLNWTFRLTADIECYNRRNTKYVMKTVRIDSPFGHAAECEMQRADR